MSKAFTKEDDEGGFLPPKSGVAPLPVSSFRLTSRGERLLRERGHPRLEAILARAEKVVPAGAADRAALGITVCVRSPSGSERMCRLVSPEERALLDDGCSIDSPLGRALLGARVGDVREVELPRGVEELEIVALELEC